MIRIYIEGDPAAGQKFKLAESQIHYLKNVMRLKTGDRFIVFGNGKEFIAEFPDAIISETNRPDPANNATLAFCPIKPARLEEMISMATQLGVARFQPVISKFTDIPKMNFDRFKKIAIEASEQSGRLSVPEFLPAQKLADFIPLAQNLIYADERTAKFPSCGGVREARGGLFTLLIGPEGGFAPEEFALLEKSGATGIGLGRTILRAETAAAAALSILLN
ncbi:MAG: 16S rRNA (uracil(1498)-N(3))-methyltransferase [Rickettsiales bacterium]|jgi:16S rRNA (uracil1498-N3)-methyltransferase|nr:16S rRNA (uracil(1498)-N(3))-methyltransferase [Rickettsiales bacterium]